MEADNTDSFVIGAFAQVGHDFTLNENWGLSPRGNIAYLHYSQDSYSDDQELDVDDFKGDSLRLNPTLSLHGNLEHQGVGYQPRFSVGLQHDDNTTAVTFGAGLDVTFTPGITGFASFDGAYGNDEERYGGNIGISIAF